MYLDNYQENYSFYRNIIYDYIKRNKEALKPFFYRENGESDENYEKRLSIDIENINKDGNMQEIRKYQQLH